MINYCKHCGEKIQRERYTNGWYHPPMDYGKAYCNGDGGQVAEPKREANKDEK